MKGEPMQIQTSKGRMGLAKAGEQELFDRMARAFDDIARRAFEIFESNGRILGRDLEDWLRAEEQVLHPIHLSLSETDDRLAIEAEVPGFTTKQLQIHLEPRRLTISGNREKKEERKEDKVLYSECCADQILRVVELPVEVDPAKATAVLKDGVLVFTLPKAVRAKEIPLKSKAA